MASVLCARGMDPRDWFDICIKQRWSVLSRVPMHTGSSLLRAHRFVAAGGEDDLVAVYSIAERFPILHLEGHNSWVSRVQWDPWLQYGSTQTQPGANNGASNGVGAGADMSGVYRLASVGQDAQLCLWDVQTGMSEGETLPFNSLQGLSGLSMR